MVFVFVFRFRIRLVTCCCAVALQSTRAAHVGVPELELARPVINSAAPFKVAHKQPVDETGVHLLDESRERPPHPRNQGFLFESYMKWPQDHARS